MALFLDWFNWPGQMDGILRAGVAHLWFETIHPFEDGNGRIGRAIIDMAIAQDARQEARLYSMSRQMQKNRSAYYDVVNQAQKGDLDITLGLPGLCSNFLQPARNPDSISTRPLKKHAFGPRTQIKILMRVSVKRCKNGWMPEMTIFWAG